MEQYQACLYYFNAILMMIPSMVIKFPNVDIFEKYVQFGRCRLLTPAACMVSVSTQPSLKIGVLITQFSICKISELPKCNIDAIDDMQITWHLSYALTINPFTMYHNSICHVDLYVKYTNVPFLFLYSFNYAFIVQHNYVHIECYCK